MEAFDSMISACRTRASRRTEARIARSLSPNLPWPLRVAGHQLPGTVRAPLRRSARPLAMTPTSLPPLLCPCSRPCRRGGRRAGGRAVGGREHSDQHGANHGAALPIHVPGADAGRAARAARLQPEARVHAVRRAAAVRRQVPLRRVRRQRRDATMPRCRDAAATQTRACAAKLRVARDHTPTRRRA